MRLLGLWLLILGFAFSGTLLKADDSADQQKAADAIKKLGGKVKFDDQQNVIEVDLEETRITDEDLRHLKSFPMLRKLDLEETRITDAGLVHLKGLTQLQHLDLEETRITDAGLEHLKELMSLRRLNLSDTQVTAAGIRALQEALPELEIER